MADGVGCRTWAVAEGYIPSWSNGPEPEFASHEALCLLNAAGEAAHVEITVYFEARDPIGPYKLEVPPRRTRHVRLNELDSPRRIPSGVNYSSLIRSDVPVVVQHTRLDSRQAENGLMTTIAYPCER